MHADITSRTNELVCLTCTMHLWVLSLPAVRLPFPIKGRQQASGICSVVRKHVAGG